MHSVSPGGRPEGSGSSPKLGWASSIARRPLPRVRARSGGLSLPLAPILPRGRPGREQPDAQDRERRGFGDRGHAVADDHLDLRVGQVGWIELAASSSLERLQVEVVGPITVRIEAER